MKKLALAISVLAISAVGASAADMAPAPVYTKAPLPPPVLDWTGWYIGANAGYSWGQSSSFLTGTTSVPSILAFPISTNMDGGLGGGQIGYNWQFNRNLLFGFEADIQGTGQRGTADAPIVRFTFPGIFAPGATITATGNLAQSLPWFGTVRARLGFEPSDHWLLYVTGGLAYGEIDSTATATTTLGGTTLTTSGSVNNTQVGWTVGAGAEWWLQDRWSVKAEYLYMDLGHVNDSYTFTGLATGGFATAAINSHITDNIVRVGINYHFAGPVVAKY